MTNEIDRLMSLDPLELSAQNIDEIILYQRKQRLAYESGAKPRKAEATASIDLKALGLIPTGAPVARRTIG